MSSLGFVLTRELLSLSVRINVRFSPNPSAMNDTDEADVSAVMGLDDYEEIGKFFAGFMFPQGKDLPGSKL